MKYIINYVISFVAILFFMAYSTNCRGLFQKKYTRDEAIQNFIKNEKEFENIVIYFKSILPKDKDVTILFNLGKKNTINLYVDLLKSDANSIIKGENLTLKSPQLDSILIVIGWTDDTIINLRDKLSKVNCETIMNKKTRVDYIVMHLHGDQNYYYTIHDNPISYSKPISNKGLGAKATVSYRADGP